jgi:ligand-binding SRPBCC domain-containing protein
MPVIEFETLVHAPLAKVWAFHQDIQSLVKLSPPEDDVTIECADAQLREGSRIVINAKGPLTSRIEWVAKIVEQREPRAVVFGEEARFVDVQERGPFSSWRHEHEFEHVDEKTTRCRDRITYRVPLGPIGWLADVIFVRRKLSRMFRYRHEQLRRLLE